LGCPYKHNDKTCDIDGLPCPDNILPDKCRNRNQLLFPDEKDWRAEKEYLEALPPELPDWYGPVSEYDE